MRLTRFIPTLGAALLLAACSETSEPEGESRRGIISSVRSETLAIPETIRLGTKVEAVVNTQGVTGCTSDDGEEFVQTPRTATEPYRLRIEVYDFWKTGQVCEGEPATIVHRIQLEAADTGYVEITVAGRSSPDAAPQVINRTVIDTVRVIP